MRRFSEWLLKHEKMLLLVLDNLVWILVAVFLFSFWAIYPSIFLSGRNTILILYHSASLGLLVLAESLCLLSGNFDLSISAIAAFSATVSAAMLSLWTTGMPWFVGIVVISVLGLALGGFNGLSIGYLQVNPFLQTLGMMIILEGSAIAVYASSIYGLPTGYVLLGGGKVGPIPISVLFFIFLFLLFYFVVRRTKFGAHLLFTGDNPQAAKVSGVDTRRVILAVFMLSGLLSAWAGLMLTGFVGAAVPRMAEGLVFEAFAAAIIGGISLRGGKGSVLGALGGVLLLGVLRSGMNLSGVQAVYVKVINGILVLVAVLLDNLKEKVKKRMQLNSG